MILQCPECSARFAVPDGLVPPEGRTVKCGRCAHQWHADGPIPMEGEDFAAMAQQAAEASETAEYEAPVVPRQLPVRVASPLPRLPFVLGTVAAAASWLIVAFIAYFPSWMEAPVLRGIYESFGVRSTAGLVFEDISMQRNQVEAQTQFLISGSVTNRSAETRMVPAVRVQLKNKEGAAIWERVYPVNEPLEAGKPYAFRIDNVATAFAGSVSSVVLDVGHPLQLMMR